MLSHVFLLSGHLLPLIQTTIDNRICYYQEPRYHEALHKDTWTAAQTLQKADRGAWAEARRLETPSRFVGGHQSTPTSPPGRGCAAQVCTQHRGERQVSFSSGASLRPDNFGGEVGAQVSYRRDLTLELCQLQQSCSSINQGATFMRSRWDGHNDVSWP